MKSLLETAYAKRLLQPELADGTTDCFRVCDGAADGLPGVFIDSFAGHWLVQTKNVDWPVGLDATKRQLGWRSLWWKRLDQSDKDSPKWMSGDRTDHVVTKENGVSYNIDFTAGYSQGIFLDQRWQRRWLVENCTAGQRLLNLFAYTCGFSVAAAAAGALTESIDLSRPYLDWGKRNFELNGLSTDGHFFCRGDSFDWLARLTKKGKQYEIVVLDPPTFSRNDEGKIWKADRDYPQLVAAATAVLAPGGRLLCSTNHFGLSHNQFTKLVREGVRQAKAKVVDVELGKMPEDFTGDDYLKVVWMQVEQGEQAVSA